MSSDTSNNLVIRKGDEQDLPQMVLLFQDTITSICKEDYNPHQLDAWKSGAENKERWHHVMKEQYVLIAEIENQIVGFCTLDQGNFIDLLFVHKNYQHQGIASRLYQLIEKEALKRQQKFLIADVSKTAKPFFQSMDFKVIQEQIVQVRGIDLTNYKMEKRL